MFALLLFAQAQGPNGPPPPPPGFAAGLFMTLLICFGVFLVLALLPQIFFLLTLHKALGRCRPRCRTQEPAMVWLALIPFLNLVWIFINVIRVAESLQSEFRARRWHRRDEDYGHSIGIAYCCLALAGIIPYIGILFGLGGFVCWIIYWVKIAGLSGQLAEGGRRDRYEDDYDNEYDEYDDEEDDRRRRRRDRDADEDEEDDRKPWERRDR